MAKIRYKVVKCRECDVEFLVRPIGNAKYFCPACGERFTDVQADHWMPRPVRYKRPWTADEDKTLRMLIKAGYSYQQISEEIKRKPKSIGTRIWRLRKEGRFNDCKADRKST